MASTSTQSNPSAAVQGEPQTIELNKKTAIAFMKQLVEKGQDAGHYSLQDSHFIFEAVRVLEYDDQDSKLPKPEIDEKSAFEILINAITVSQKQGHCFTLETASNAFRVAMFVTANFIKKAKKDDDAEEGDVAVAGPSNTPSRLPLKKA